MTHNRITPIQNQSPSWGVTYGYEFRVGLLLEDAGNHCGLDVKDDLFEALLSDFKVELYSKIYGISKAELLEMQRKVF